MTGDVVTQVGTIVGNVISKMELAGTVQHPTGADMPVYDGDYEVVPASYEQQLQTKDKFVKKDITVKSIPFIETSNDDGTTVYIG